MGEFILYLRYFGGTGKVKKLINNKNVYIKKEHLNISKYNQAGNLQKLRIWKYDQASVDTLNQQNAHKNQSEIH